MYTTEAQARAATVTAKQAEREINKHCLSFADFQAECGVRPMYKGSTILNWLGY